jgi:3-deoxy-D-manno-octulosonic-acid transferase
LRHAFFYIYYTLSVLVYILALPVVLYFSFRSKYKVSLPARFFLQKTPSFREEGIWFHACSLGEAKALEPFIEQITKTPVNISVITHTGFSAASSYKNATVRYLPYEMFLPFWIKKQRLLIVLEAELWYMLFAVAKAKGTKTVLLNARISDRSYPKYLKMKWFYSRLLRHIDLIYVQSEVDAERFRFLGADNPKVIGNIKLAQKITATKSYIKPTGLSFVGGSTHVGEEKAILDAYVEFKKVHKEYSHLILVPRHPERFEAVHQMMSEYAQEHDLRYVRFSQEPDLEADIILVDKMGELNNIYKISDVCILGGAFTPVGGHNPLEPVHFGCKIITGEQIFNQRELFKYVKNVQFIHEDELASAMVKAIDMPASSIEESVDLDEIHTLIRES